MGQCQMSCRIESQRDKVHGELVQTKGALVTQGLSGTGLKEVGNGGTTKY